MQIGELLAKELRRGDVLALYGNLGSGKTTFVQGLANGLGITRRIISPTFVIVRSYKLRTNNDEQITKYLYHVDLYRMENEKDIEGIGLHEILQDKFGIIVIEWAEKIVHHLPKRRWDIMFEYRSETKRVINTIKKNI